MAFSYSDSDRVIIYCLPRSVGADIKHQKMKTLVLNTLDSEYTEQVKTLIKDKEVEIVDTSDMKIVHCMGCNQCWLNTPGICAYKDDYEIILKKLVQADNLWIVSDSWRQFWHPHQRGCCKSQDCCTLRKDGTPVCTERQLPHPRGKEVHRSRAISLAGT